MKSALNFLNQKPIKKSAEKHLSTKLAAQQCASLGAINMRLFITRAGLACKKISRSDCFLQGHKLIPAAIKIHRRHSKSILKLKLMGAEPRAAAEAPLVNKLGADFCRSQEDNIIIISIQQQRVRHHERWPSAH